MDVLHERCAALNIGKKDVKACVHTRNPSGRCSRRQEIRTYPTMTSFLLELRYWLLEQQVILVVMESTGDYWRPAFYVLEDCLNVILVSAAHAKGLPGRKTDADAAWLCQLGECGLLKAWFVPPEPVRHLRGLTRYRTSLTMERSREVQRLEKELEDAGIKLSSVATDLTGVSGRAMLTALIEGERDVHTLAGMARARMRPKIPALVEALTGNFGEYHAFLCRSIWNGSTTSPRHSVNCRRGSRRRCALFTRRLELLATVPGVGRGVAEVIIAETGGDMARFRTAEHLASWAGVCPGHHEAAGRHKSGRRRHGNRWLGAALGTAAMASSRTRDTTYLGARYRRLAPRLARRRPSLPSNTRS
ncbi:IS110 family transposase [Streptomyces sp. NPDC005799]|uniref:IS110 family transposase n=1 Tax=Streptomyces sp. NPDC005799 TaxID=3154678 RepID=UPI0033EBD069